MGVHLRTVEFSGPQTTGVANSWKAARGGDGFYFDGDGTDHRLSLAVGELGIETVRFGTMLSSGHGYRSENSSEDWFGLAFPLAGEALAETALRPLRAAANQWIVLAPGRRDVKNSAPRGGDFRSIRLLVSLDALRAHLDGNERYSGDFRDVVVPSRMPEAAALLASVQGLLGGVPSTREALGLMHDTLIEQLSDMLFASDASTSGGTPPSVTLTMVRRAEEFIRAHASENLSIAAVAQHLDITARALQLGFKSQRGQSPYRYLESVRLERAHQLLTTIEDGDSVTRIALECGFNHLGRFSLQYRSRYGVAPSESMRRARTS